MAAYHMSKAEHQSNDPIEDTHEVRSILLRASPCFRNAPAQPQ